MKKKIGLFLFIIQSLITVSVIVIGIMCLLGNNGLIKILELLVAIDLILMGICNAIMKKEKKYTIIYLVVGILMFIAAMLGILGVV